MTFFAFMTYAHPAFAVFPSAPAVDEAGAASASAVPAPEPEMLAEDGDAGAAAPESGQDAAKKTSSTARAILNGEVEILHDRRLSHLDKGPVKAYEAELRTDNRNMRYFAMVCERDLVPQSRLGPAYASINNASLVRLKASGPVYWPQAQQYRYCFVYEDGLGRPLMKNEGENGLGWRQEQIMQAVVRPMISVLMDLREADIFHGNIRPSNLYSGGQKVVERVILGDCLSTPPGFTQPVLYETIERALCDPIARGRGTFSDDLYAFGVTLAVLMRRRDPMAGMSREQIIHEKIEHGSYTALVGSERFVGAILELLRGLLHDDVGQRWTFEDLMNWLDGQRLSPKPSSKKKKAARPLTFNGERYVRQSLLAIDMQKNHSEAVRLIESGDLEQWATRSLEDSVLRNRLDTALDALKESGRGPGYWDRLISRVSIALDPEAPIRFKGLSIHPEGLPFALAQAIYKKQDVQPYVEIINQHLVLNWLNAQMDLRIDVGNLISRYDSCRAFLRQATMGYGLERALYFLCPDAPCMSDKLKTYYVRTSEDLLAALEGLSENANKSDLIIDRHIAAFLSVRDRKVIDSYWPELNAAELHRRILGNIKVLATIQRRGKTDLYPGVTSWIAEMVAPLYERYHDRELRDELRKRVSKLKDSGDIQKLVAIFDNADTLQVDFMNFRHAMNEYDTLRREFHALDTKLEKPELIGKTTGKEVAAIVSGVLSAIIILTFGFIFMADKGFF